MAKNKSKPTRRPEAQKKEVVASSAVLPSVGNSQDRVAWRFTHVDHDGRWGFAAMTSETLCEVLRKLADCESMTLGELRSTRRFFKEYDLPGGLADEAPARLAAMRRDDMTKIQRLEFTGTQRLYGFLQGNIFHVVWWDPHHEICPSTKKHT